jgi:DNA polymerase-3 subunit alpha
LLTKMKPDCFEDIIATSALYRPGPLEGGMVLEYVEVKHGRKEPREVHPVVDEVLKETYGVMVYQEQVMRILNRVGNVELASAYKCIKAISKKKQSIIDGFHDGYISGAKANNIPTQLADELWNLIVAFAGYGFNKSHSTAYGLIAYETAYLKAHFPVEFMAALLSCGMESTDRISEHVDDARRQKIEVLPPDVNRSEVEFGIDDEKITFGMGAIKGVGEGALQTIVQERQENGLFKDIFDLTERLESRALTRSGLEALIKVGALDSLPGSRAQQTEVVERALQAAISRQKDKASGQMSLFGDEENADDEDEVMVSLPDVPDWTHSQKLAAEKEALGFYLTSHPLSQHSRRIARYSQTKTRQLADLDDGESVTVTGMVGAIKIATAKKANANGQNRYANFDLEDPTGIVRCIAWPADYSRYEGLITQERIIVVQGRVDRRGREPNLIVNRMFSLDDADKEFTSQVAIKFEQGLHHRGDIESVHRVIRKYPGSTGVILVVDSVDPAAAETSTSGEVSGRLRYILTTGTGCEVSVCPEFRRDLIESIGEQFFEFKVGRF